MKWIKASELPPKVGWVQNCKYEYCGEWIGGRFYFDGNNFTKGDMSDVIGKESMLWLDESPGNEQGMNCGKMFWVE